MPSRHRAMASNRDLTFHTCCYTRSVLNIPTLANNAPQSTRRQTLWLPHDNSSALWQPDTLKPSWLMILSWCKPTVVNVNAWWCIATNTKPNHLWIIPGLLFAWVLYFSPTARWRNGFIRAHFNSTAGNIVTGYWSAKCVAQVSWNMENLEISENWKTDFKFRKSVVYACVCVMETFLKMVYMYHGHDVEKAKLQDVL